MEEDLLYKDALFYKTNFEGKKFHLKAGRKCVLLEFDILFSSDHFKHMIGLHKLKDISQLRYSSSKIYRQILNKELAFTDISFSIYYYLIENRIMFFEELKNILASKELMVKSLHGNFNTIEADYMLSYKNEEYGYVHLFLKQKNEGTVEPITFIIHDNNDYLKNNPNKWTVLSIEEIVRSE
ncbi:MAG: hypothetical protein IJ308_06620 [Clostridia bacterium]|nr:hypothetical protein [Clostridia bacterium]